MKVRMVPVAELVPMAAAYNPRRIEDSELEALGRSLEHFGAVQPIVVNRRTNRIVGGHQRVKAAEARGMRKLPVVDVDLDESSEKQLNLALNRIGGEFDEAMLAAVLEDLRRRRRAGPHRVHRRRDLAPAARAPGRRPDRPRRDPGPARGAGDAPRGPDRPRPPPVALRRQRRRRRRRTAARRRARPPGATRTRRTT